MDKQEISQNMKQVNEGENKEKSELPKKQKDDEKKIQKKN